LSARYDISWVDRPVADAARADRVVAVDAGGTKTFAVSLELATEQVTAGRAGPGNADSVGIPAAAASIADAVREATGDRPAQHAVLAVAGTNLDAAEPAIVEALGGLVENARFVNDVVAAWGTVGLGEPAVAMISGTGSHVLGVHRGVAQRVGGWGHIFGDEGSGHWLGRAAVAACLHALDGRGPETALSAALAGEGADFATWVGDLYGRGAPKHEVASFAALVDAAAGAGDEVARRLLHQAAADLYAHLATVLRLTPGLAGAPIGLLGSTWHSDTLHSEFIALLAPEQREVTRRIDLAPALGALALALRSIGRADLCTPERFTAFAK
jgi:N-acetylglucosamine kinase-like BadF-type ATPase